MKKQSLFLSLSLWNSTQPNNRMINIIDLIIQKKDKKFLIYRTIILVKNNFYKQYNLQILWDTDAKAKRG